MDPVPDNAQCTKASLTIDGLAEIDLAGIVAQSNGASGTCHGVYVHVPFCAHRCHYCDFFTIAGREDAHEAYVERLLDEAKAAHEVLREPVSTIFIGGGTPTLLEPSVLARLLSGLDRIIPRRVDAEWTVEANPETVSDECARVLAEHGVTRVSLGAQSFDAGLLDALERRHDPANVARAVERLRGQGIGSISLDLIFGVPGQTPDLWAADLECALALSPEHLSCYGLTYEPGTPLKRRLEAGQIEAVDDSDEATMYLHTRDRLRDARFDHYEISNWARPGHACRHNLGYWKNASWWALGPSASGHLAPWRWRNVPRLGAWLDQRGHAAIDRVERLDEDGRLGEALMLGLRCIEGVTRKQLDTACGDAGRGPDRKAAVQRHLASGLLERSRGNVTLSQRGQLLADLVLRDLL